MHGLPVTTDLGELEGCDLTFVGFGQYQLQLGFSGDPDCGLSVEGDYLLSTSDGSATTFSTAVSGASGLLRLLGTRVVSADVPEDGTVRIAFADGTRLEVLDSSERYESYQLNLGRRLIVV